MVTRKHLILNIQNSVVGDFIPKSSAVLKNWRQNIQQLFYEGVLVMNWYKNQPGS